MEPKPGVRTSEFWTTLIAAAGPYVLALTALIGLITGGIEADLALPLMGLFFGIGSIGGGYAAGKYADSRAKVKTGPAPTEAIFEPHAPDINNN